MRIVIDIPNESLPGRLRPDGWRFVPEILDMIEPGAGAHTLGISPDPGFPCRTQYRHHRLGVSIDIDTEEV